MSESLENIGPVLRAPAAAAFAMTANDGAFVVLNDGRMLTDASGNLASIMAELVEAPHLSDPVRAAVDRIRQALDALGPMDLQQTVRVMVDAAVKSGLVLGEIKAATHVRPVVRVDYDREVVPYQALATLARFLPEFNVLRPDATGRQTGVEKPVSLQQMVNTTKADRAAAMAREAAAPSQPVRVDIKPGAPPAPTRRRPGGDAPDVQ